MKEKDLILEMIKFIDEHQHYYAFLAFCKENGFDEEDVDKAISAAQGF